MASIYSVLAQTPQKADCETADVCDIIFLRSPIPGSRSEDTGQEAEEREFTGQSSCSYLGLWPSSALCGHEVGEEKASIKGSSGIGGEAVSARVQNSQGRKSAQSSAVGQRGV